MLGSVVPSLASFTSFYERNNIHLRLLTGLGFCSRTRSDTFRRVLIHGKEQEPRKKILHYRAKNFTFLRAFDRKNTLFFIYREIKFEKVTLNARQSPADSL